MNKTMSIWRRAALWAMLGGKGLVALGAGCTIGLVIGVVTGSWALALISGALSCWLYVAT